MADFNGKMESNIISSENHQIDTPKEKKGKKKIKKLKKKMSNLKAKLQDEKRHSKDVKRYYKEHFKRKNAEFERDFYRDLFNKITSNSQTQFLSRENLGLPATFIEGECEVVDDKE